MLKEGIKVCDFCEEPLLKEVDNSINYCLRTTFFSVLMVDKDNKIEDGLICNDCLVLWLTDIPEYIKFLNIIKE